MEFSQSRKPSTTMNHEKFFFKVIEPAIRSSKSCPICLRHIEHRKAAILTVCKHVYCVDCIHKWSNLKRKCPLCNADFNSWLFRISLSRRTFQKHQLGPLGTNPRSSDRFEVTRNRFMLDQRIIRRSRTEVNRVNQRNRPLPWRRSFGRPGSEPSNVAEWRASIYKRGLEAIPINPKENFSQVTPGNNAVKQRILQRIEPWILRELEAVLNDPDPDVIVHVATSLYISHVERKARTPSGRIGDNDNFISPLRPFLYEHTTLFWHELRCFAESSLTMETYDSVVEYKELENST